MAKDKGTTTTSADDGGMVTILFGDAAAFGQDTLASVEATLGLTDHGNVTKATGVVMAVAISDGSGDGNPFVLADTDVFVSGADKVHIKTSTIPVEQGGVSYEISVLTFKAMDHANKDGEMTMKIHDKSPDTDHPGHDVLDLTIQLDGNVATAIFDAQASADNSLVQVEASVLAVQDELSLSTIMTTAAVG
jgi:hypothetical protein